MSCETPIPMAPIMRTLRRPHLSTNMMAGMVEKKLITPTAPVASKSIEFPERPMNLKICGAVDDHVDSSEFLDHLKQASYQKTPIQGRTVKSSV
jgi:hypothetical protein